MNIHCPSIAKMPTIGTQFTHLKKNSGPRMHKLEATIVKCYLKITRIRLPTQSASLLLIMWFYPESWICVFVTRKMKTSRVVETQFHQGVFRTLACSKNIWDVKSYVTLSQICFGHRNYKKFTSSTVLCALLNLLCSRLK